MKKISILLLSIITLFSCDPSDCGDMLYSTGPPILHVEIVDADSGENVFTNGTLLASDIIVINENEDNVNFNFIDENDYNIIQFTPYTYSEKNTVFIKIGENINAKVTFNVKEIKGDCNTVHYIENILVENFPYELVNDTGVLKIKV